MGFTKASYSRIHIREYNTAEVFEKAEQLVGEYYTKPTNIKWFQNNGSDEETQEEFIQTGAYKKRRFYYYSGRGNWINKIRLQ